MSADGDFMRTVKAVTAELAGKIEASNAARDLDNEVVCEGLSSPLTMHHWSECAGGEFPEMVLARLIQEAAEQIREAEIDREHTLWGI